MLCLMFPGLMIICQILFLLPSVMGLSPLQLSDVSVRAWPACVTLNISDY